MLHRDGCYHEHTACLPTPGCGQKDGFAGFPFLFQQVGSQGFSCLSRCSPVEWSRSPVHPLWCDVPAGMGQQALGLPSPSCSPVAPTPPEPVQMPFTDTQLCNQLITMQMHAPFPHTTSCFLSASFLEIRCFLWECDPSARSHLEPSQPRSPGRLELAPTLSRTSPPWLLKSSCPLFSACLHTLGPLVHPRARSTSWRQTKRERSGSCISVTSATCDPAPAMSRV